MSLASVSINCHSANWIINLSYCAWIYWLISHRIYYIPRSWIKYSSGCWGRRRWRSCRVRSCWCTRLCWRRWLVHNLRITIRFWVLLCCNVLGLFGFLSIFNKSSRDMTHIICILNHAFLIWAIRYEKVNRIEGNCRWFSLFKRNLRNSIYIIKHLVSNFIANTFVLEFQFRFCLSILLLELLLQLTFALFLMQ